LVEIKARCTNLEYAKEILKKVNAEYIGKFHQIDTYFILSDELKLKLRSIDNKNFILIYYKRPNIADIKKSNVILHKVTDPNSLIKILGDILGIKVVVDKIREIYRYMDVQIHLDTVRNLGSFIEFEKSTNRDSAEKDMEVIRKLMKLFKISSSDLIPCSYGELLLKSL